VRTLIFIIVIFSTACAPLVPATTPPQLEHTPGAFVVVTDSTFDGGNFIVDYPASWRVVKSSIAEADTIQVVFVASDENTITLTEVVNAGNDSENEQFITLSNDVVIQVVIERADEPDAVFDTYATHLIESIRASTD